MPMGLTALLFSPIWSVFVENKLHAGTSFKNEKKLVLSFNIAFRYFDDVLSLNNLKFGYYADRIYPIELETGHHKYSYVCFIP